MYSEIKKGNSLCELPLGVLRCTFEKHPRIVFANDEMEELFGAKQNPEEWERYKNGTLFFMLPVGERERFRNDLKMMEQSEKPVKVVHRYIRCDESEILLEGWGCVEKTEKGGSEYCFVYGETLENDDDPTWSASLFQTLREAYDILFEIDFARNTLECVHTVFQKERRSLYRLRMQTDSGFKHLLEKYIEEQDHEKLQKFYDDVIRMHEENCNNPTVEFRVHDMHKKERYFFGTATQLNSSMIIVCCKDNTDAVNGRKNADHIEALMQMYNHFDIVSARHALGMLSFRYEGGMIYPIFASRSALNFIKSSPDELLDNSLTGITLEELLMRTGIAFEDFMKLMSNGTVQTYISEKDSEVKWRVRMICKNLIPDQLEIYDLVVFDDRDNNGNNIMDKVLPEDRPAENMNSLTVQRDGDRSVFIQTFGFFDIFVDGKPIAFRHEKSKEMLAILVDRRGGFLTASEMISYLWEDEPADKTTLARCRKTAMYLKQELEEYGIGYIIDISNGKRRIVPEKVSCDLYDFLTGKSNGRKAFYGTYMKNYSWSEMTLTELINMSE